MTELIWDGKYKDGKKTTPVRIALPFQTIETINESKADRDRTIELFARQTLLSRLYCRCIGRDALGH
jgi:hypothetical protein